MTNPSLETFFRQHGAVFADQQIAFGETPADFARLGSQTTVSVMLYHSLLAVTSADNLKFLQGQFTCDLREVDTQHWRYGALCTAKGRMTGNFLLLQAGDNQHLLRLHTSSLEPVQTALKKFAPFYKGRVDNAGNDYVLLGLHGPGSADIVAQLFGRVPEHSGAVQDKQAIAVRLDEQCFECWVRTEALERLWPVLTTRATPTGCAFWQLLNIRAGLGEVRAATVEAWTPHMLNLQAIHAISFTKGCYTGQEIVARTEYRGQQKRAMYHIAGSGDVPAAGAAVLDGEQHAGDIVMASPADAQHWEALAVLGESHRNHALRCNSNAVHLLELPYPVGKQH